MARTAAKSSLVVVIGGLRRQLGHAVKLVRGFCEQLGSYTHARTRDKGSIVLSSRRPSVLARVGTRALSRGRLRSRSPTESLSRRRWPRRRCDGAHNRCHSPAGGS